jgi:hypothetical protein
MFKDISEPADEYFKIQVILISPPDLSQTRLLQCFELKPLSRKAYPLHQKL